MIRLRSIFSRLSPRERTLAAIAAALAIGFALTYGAILPGIDARASAESRNARAITDLAEAQSLVGAVSSQTPTQQDLDGLVASASERGLSVVDAQLINGSAVLRIAAASSRDVLMWAAEASRTTTPLRSLAIVREATDTLEIDAAFSGQVS